MSSNGIASVDTYARAIESLLDRARQKKPQNSSEPALTATDFGGMIEEIRRLSNNSFITNNQAHYAAIETACRNIFYNLLASTPVGDSSSELWNLLDVVSILSDKEQCEPGLVFWLVEELLDSQTIDGCRHVFDYLDSRRERITAKHFKKKELIILRACNELLRRLSRAEDTVFCGRVFIFLFQSFPLGDRSSVNLRGEYHVENITVFEDSPALLPSASEANIDDTKVEAAASFEESTEAISAPGENKDTGERSSPEVKPGEVNEPQKKRESEDPLETNKLYPVFWSLQESFSMPTRLFDSQHFKVFKEGLDLTIRKFQSVQQELQARGPSRNLDDTKRITKRKRGGLEDEMLNSFNPRYLTSRDLFELEISDLAFRRHILVQALILIDFLLSLTLKAKKKLENSTNKSVLYGYTLSEDDATWATQMRSEIATYLQQGLEGKFYYRMVDTVLSRDKNWAHWKADGCPLIARTPISADDFANAQKGASRVCANKKLRATPIGSLDLKFLSDGANADGLEKLKYPDRYSIPSVESFKDPIARDEFELDLAKTEEEKQLTTNARSSKLWRALRIASKDKFNIFDRIDDGNNLQALFQSEGDESRGRGENNGADQAGKESPPTEAEPIPQTFENGAEVPLETAVK